MTGERRRIEYVVARSIARALSLSVAGMALANLFVFWGAFLWLQKSHATAQVLWSLRGAMLVQFIAAVVALIAFGWSR